MSTIHRRGVLLDGIGKELVRSANGGPRKTLSQWLATLQNSIELEDLAETFTSGDATPDVSGSAKWITAGSTAITDFDGGTEGQVIHVYRGDSDIVITDNGNIDPIIAGNLTLSATKPSASFRLDAGVWKQVSESGAQSAAMAPVVQAATLALGRTAFGVPGLADSNVFTGAVDRFKRIFLSAADSVWNLASNTLAALIYFSSGGTVSVAASKQLDVLHWTQTLTVDSGGLVHFGNCNLTIASGSHATANVRGWVANLISQGSAIIKAIYGRVEATGASDGVIAAFTGQVVPGASTSAAYGVQLAGDSTARKIDYGYQFQAVSSAVSLDYGLLLADGVAVGQAGLQMFADGAGNLVRLKNAAGSADLFTVTSAGAIGECKGLTLNGASTIGSTMTFGSQVSAAFGNGTRTWSWQGITTGDYFRLLASGIGDMLIVRNDGDIEPTGDLTLASGKRVDFQNSQSTVGSAGAASALPAQPTGYIPIKVGGSAFVVPYYAAS